MSLLRECLAVVKQLWKKMCIHKGENAELLHKHKGKAKLLQCEQKMLKDTMPTGTSLEQEKRL